NNNICLSTVKDNLSETLSDFSNVFDIDSNMLKILKVMNLILPTIEISYNPS
ncbi:12049_t:CDS:2, partial [Funneliformis geosporum]